MDVKVDAPSPDHRIAIVGRAGRFPAARSVGEFWTMLAEGRMSAQRLREADLLAQGVSRKLLADPAYVPVANVLPDMECFDAGFFGFSPREASILDPQHRHFLECGWEALEDAGHMPERFPGRIGVFAGSGMQAYLPFNLLSNPDLVEEIGLFLLRHTGNDKDFLPTRLSYLLNLTGPSIAIQTACSTSLVAVHAAIGSLQSMECDMAIAGGVTIELPHRVGYKYLDGEILSPDGMCRAFDDDSRGTIFGSGAALVVLRRYADAVADGDDIKAVILASAVNNDGGGKASYLAPSVDGQAEAAAEALALSGVRARDISYIETHGTGTPIGDPIELAALKQVYGAAPAASIGIGSVKTNIGHLDTAAGTASLIKVVESLRHRKLPASLGLRKPNSRFDFANSPFQVVAEGRAWASDTPLRAAVNSLGVGGTNAHVIVEEAPRKGASVEADNWQLFPFSARTDESLSRTRERWSDFLRIEQPAAQDVAFTLREGRRAFSERFAVAARNVNELRAAISAKASDFRRHGRSTGAPPRVVFLFPGGGAQYPGAGTGLLATNPAFAEAVHECFSLLPPDAPRDLYEVMFERGKADADASAKLNRSSYALPALFILEYAYAKLWESWNVRPDAILAHSIGEYAGAVVAGAMRLADALRVVALRGKVMDDAPKGAMTSVPLGVDSVRELIGDKLDIAAINTSNSTVVSGLVADIEQLERSLAGGDSEARRIHIDVAAHSRQLDSQLERFRAGFEGVKFSTPLVRMVSSTRGDWATGNDLVSADYWVKHLREPVRFADAVKSGLGADECIVLEVGPGQTLGPLVASSDAPRPPRAVLPSGPRPRDDHDEMGIALSALGGLWANGVDIDWSKVAAAAGRRVSLPTYAFERQRHWIEPGRGVHELAQDDQASELVRLADQSSWFESAVWTERPRSGPATDLHGDWLIFAGDDAVSQVVLQRLHELGAQTTLVRAGANFERLSDGFTLRPDAQEDFETLAETLTVLPSRILFLWGADPSLVEKAFSGAYLLCRFLQQADPTSAIHLTFVALGSATIQGAHAANPELASLLGPARVAPREIPRLTSALVDVGGSIDADGLLAEAAGPNDADHVALRGRQRFVRERHAGPATLPDTLPRRLRDGGVYLITGGTGGIGRELALWLGSVAKARVALLSRSAKEDIELRDKMRGLGGDVVFIPADVRDANAVQNAISEIAAHFGQVNGVIHAAGVLDDAPLALQPLETARTVMDTKIEGAKALDLIFPVGSLDFFAVISSTSVIIGGAGQTTYVGGNAALEAFAARRTDGLSIAWGAWRDVGMAVRAYGAGERIAGRQPLIGRRVDTSDGAIRFETLLDPKTDWRAEHVVGGSSVLPGAACIELAYAAARTVLDDRPFAIDAVQFTAPLVFDDAVQPIEIRLSRDEGGYDLTIGGGNQQMGEPAEHFRARIVPNGKTICPAAPVVTNDWARSPLGGRPVQGNLVAFGGRWNCVGEIRVREKEAVGEFALDAAFAGDLSNHPLHPALLDMAVTIGLAALELDGSVYAPMSVGRIATFGPLPNKIRSHAVCVSHQAGRFASFNVLIHDEAGNLLVSLDDFALRAIPPESLGKKPSRSSIPAQLLATGIRQSEAGELFRRIFDYPAPQMVVSPVPLDLVRLAITEITAAPASTPAKSEQTIDDPVAAQLAAIWGDILGVSGIQPNDDFFALGGHSLSAVRMLARVRKEFGLALSLGRLFAAARLVDLADIIKEHIGPSAGVELQVESEVETAPAPTPQVQVAETARSIRMTDGQIEIAGGIIVNPATSLGYNLSFSMLVEGPIDPGLLQQALADLVQRHDVLRASFDLKNSSLTIHPQRGVDFQVHDLGLTAEDARDAYRDNLLTDLHRTEFDLANGPLLRSRLFIFTPQRSEIVLAVHHIACDGWSAGILMRDLALLYTAAVERRAAQLPPAQSIADFVAAEIAWRNSPSAEEHRQFWLKKFAGPLPVLDLPYDQRPASPRTDAQAVITRVGVDLEKALRRFARTADTSVGQVIFAAFRFYLARMSGASDLVVGLPAAGQLAHGMENAVGHCVSLLPIRCRIEKEVTVAELIRQARQDLIEAMDHQTYTHGSLVRDLQLPRSSQHHLLSPVVVNLDGLADLNGLKFGSKDATFRVNSTGHEFFDLFFNAFDAPGRIELTWNYKQALFFASTIEQHARNFRSFLEAIANAPDALSRPAAEFLRGDTARPASGTFDDPGAAGPQTVTEVFRSVAKQCANNVAQRFGSKTMTYRELDERSDALAEILIERGVRPGHLVGVSSQRSLALVVAILGVLKAGAGYVPFDVDLPHDRLQFMANDTDIKILIGDCPAVAAAGVQTIDHSLVPRFAKQVPRVALDGDSIAYVMFTSGTTGVPKGVVVPHRSIVRMLCSNHWLKLSSRTVTLHSSAFAFDTSIIDFFAALLHGGEVIIPPDGKLSIAQLSEAIASHGVNTLWLTSGLFHAVVDSRPNVFATVDQLVVGGDVVSPSHVERAMTACPHLNVVNGYGPTESNVTNAHPVTVDDLIRGTSLPIGQAIAGTQIYIVDEKLRPLPPGIMGELCIAGRGLALGYWNRPELTAEKFVTAPWNPYLKFYRSGDLAMDSGNGEIRFFGRADTQVKIRGFRVELTEVETALERHPAVRQAIVVATVPANQSDKVLAAYCVTDERLPSSVELRAHLALKLPDFAIPSFFFSIDEVPLNSNGKPDRQALLSNPIRKVQQDEGDELLGDAELRLAAIWSDILGVRKLSAQANFFELGGHSLLAVRLFDRIRREFGRDLPISTLFSNQTIRQLAAFLEPTPGAGELNQPNAEWDTSTVIDPGPSAAANPIFIVGGVGGNVNNLFHLGALLGKRRAVVGFQTRGVQGHTPHSTIEEMAAENIRWMRQHQSDGPYVLAGYSGGAYTALEMTRQLEAAGERVERLFVLDTYAPGFAQDFRPPVTLGLGERLVSEFELLRDQGLGHLIDRLRTKIRNSINRGPMLKVMKRLSLSNYRYAMMQNVWMAAARRYTGGPISAPVTLFRTRPIRYVAKRTLELDPTLGWAAICDPDLLDTPWVEGDHLNMLDGHNARYLAEMFDARIDPNTNRLAEPSPFIREL